MVKKTTLINPSSPPPPPPPHPNTPQHREKKNRDHAHFLVDSRHAHTAGVNRAIPAALKPKHQPIATISKIIKRNSKIIGPAFGDSKGYYEFELKLAIFESTRGACSNMAFGAFHLNLRKCMIVQKKRRINQMSKYEVERLLYQVQWATSV